MSYFIKKIVCLANSRKVSGRCIAGKEIENKSIGSWIRPVSSRPDEEISEEDSRYENGQMPKLLDIIEIPLKEYKPTSFQKENYLIHESYYWERKGSFDPVQLPGLCDHPKKLWGGKLIKDTNFSSYQGLNDRIPKSLIDQVKASLYLISPTKLDILVRREGAEFGDEKRKVRAEFTYNDIRYILPVTDPVVERKYLANTDGNYAINKPFNKIFMCVSLGLPYKDDFCYKFSASFIGLLEYQSK